MNMDKLLKFLPDAKAAQGRSKDRSTKVGAVALDDAMVIKGSGYNGFPRGVDDYRDERHERPAKYRWTVHAEMNVIAQAARPVLEGTTLILTSLHPCAICAGMLIQAGVKRVVAPEIRHPGTGELRFDWSEDEKIAFDMLSEAGVDVYFYSEDLK